jgi:hypothetical protein
MMSRLHQRRVCGVMRTIALIACGLVLASLPAVPAALAGADTEPVIVIPGRPGVPLIVNGVDISGAVIEGDWGLARPQIGLTMVPLPPLGPCCGPGRPAPIPRVGGYFPGNGRPPPIGRLEVLPKQPPAPAQPYYRQWESESAPLPATIDPPYPMPPIVVSPTWGGGPGPWPGPGPRPPGPWPGPGPGPGPGPRPPVR